jgi:RNA polymerase sigma factor (TIGR02999 family)
MAIKTRSIKAPKTPGVSTTLNNQRRLESNSVECPDRRSEMENQDALNALAHSEQTALDEMVTRTYAKIKQIAARMPGVAPGTSVSPTVVANETYMKFLRSKNSKELAHREVIGIFVRLMEEILVDLARRRNAHKRGGGQRPAALDEKIAENLADPKTRRTRHDDVHVVRDAIQKLRISNCRWAEIVEGRFYLGLTTQELAKLLKISVTSVERDYKSAIGFLSQIIGKQSA